MPRRQPSAAPLVRLAVLAAAAATTAAENATAVTAVPDGHAATLAKPAVDAFVLYLINLSQENVEPQCLREAAAATYEGAAAQVRWPAASWSRTNVSLGSTVSGPRRNSPKF